MLDPGALDLFKLSAVVCLYPLFSEGATKAACRGNGGAAKGRSSGVENASLNIFVKCRNCHLFTFVSCSLSAAMPQQNEGRCPVKFIWMKETHHPVPQGTW